MKKKILVVLGSVLLLGACGEETAEINENVLEEEVVTQTGKNEYAGGAFAVKELKIELDQENQEDILLVKYEEEANGVVVEYEDMLQNVSLSGAEALKLIEPKLKELSITPESTKEQVIQQIENVFEIESSYEKLEIEATYPNGEEKDYENTK